MADKMTIWNSVRTPHTDALKKISGGRLSGFTDINPQWRWRRLTEVLGPCGYGWKYEKIRQEMVAGSDGQIACFVDVLLYIRADGTTWSEPIPGTGGSMFVAKEKSGPYTNDEAPKMAFTDALGNAAKMIGLAADVYMDNMGDSNYQVIPDQTEPVTLEQSAELLSLIQQCEQAGAANALDATVKHFQIGSMEELPAVKFQTVKSQLEAKLAKLRGSNADNNPK